MQTFKTRTSLSAAINSHKRSGSTVGFVPTMGALHDGHISLLQQAKKENTLVVCSIFVNPSQFTNQQDLQRYPRTLEADMLKLEEAGCDLLYAPEERDVYPEGSEKAPKFEFGGLEDKLEGAARPGHFAGVAQVVSIFLDIVRPDKLYLGQKDYQQVIILSKLLQYLQLNTEIIVCPIVREVNGLAMSSRNERLSPEGRQRAGSIYRSLQYALSLLDILPVEEVETCCYNALNSFENFEADYVEVLDAKNLEEIQENTDRIVIVTAVIVDGVRLLDNITAERKMQL